MIDLYSIVDECKESGLSSSEAMTEYWKAVEKERNDFLESYYSDPYVIEGAIQQDTIDMYRRER